MSAQTSQTDSREPQVAYIDESGVKYTLPSSIQAVQREFLQLRGTYNVLATERDSGGRPFSTLANLSDRAIPPPGNLTLERAIHCLN